MTMQNDFLETQLFFFPTKCIEEDSWLLWRCELALKLEEPSCPWIGSMAKSTCLTRVRSGFQSQSHLQVSVWLY